MPTGSGYWHLLCHLVHKFIRSVVGLSSEKEVATEWCISGMVINRIQALASALYCSSRKRRLVLFSCYRICANALRDIRRTVDVRYLRWVLRGQVRQWGRADLDRMRQLTAQDGWRSRAFDTAWQTHTHRHAMTSPINKPPQLFNSMSPAATRAARQLNIQTYGDTIMHVYVKNLTDVQLRRCLHLR